MPSWVYRLVFEFSQSNVEIPTSEQYLNPDSHHFVRNLRSRYFLVYTTWELAGHLI